MKNKKHWTEQLEEVMSEHDHFGHNTEVDIKWLLHKIDVLSAGSSKIEIEDEYTIKLSLPSKHEWREQVLLTVLTMSPLPTECRYNKNKDVLTLEWHY